MSFIFDTYRRIYSTFLFLEGLLKKYVVMGLFVITSFLSACGAVQQAQLKSALVEAKAEIASQCYMLTFISPQELSAWQRAGSETEHCHDGAKPWPRTTAMKISECMRMPLQTHVSKVSYSPEKFKKYLSERNLDYQRYADGTENWETLSQKGDERFMNYFQGGDAGSYFNYAICHNNILTAKVFPVYSNQLKPLLTEFMTNLLAYARQADKNKIGREDFAIGEQKLYSEFVFKEQQLISAYQRQNTQEWQQFFQNAQTQVNQIEQKSVTGCRALDIAPMASLGCQNVCIDGRWSEVCGR